MRRFVLNIAVSISCVICTTPCPAHDNDFNGYLYVPQRNQLSMNILEAAPKTDSHFSVVQFGGNNTVSIRQAGFANNAAITQSGFGHTAVVRQR